MIRFPYAILALSIALAMPAQAISNNGTFDTTEPTDATVNHWDSGWGTYNDAHSITGWDYVGEVSNAGGSASGVYLGNGWVITAAHVGAGTFLLDGTSYSAVDGTVQNIGTADLTLFKISATPLLTSLNLSSALPTGSSAAADGSSVVMIGYGGAAGADAKSWGEDIVNETDVPIHLDGTSYLSNDYLTVDGSTTYTNGPSPRTVTNTSRLVVGDSGGANFTFNSASGLWELTGINEAVGSGTDDGEDITFSAMVQVDTYAPEILAVTAAVPEPSSGALLGIGLLGIGVLSRRRIMRQQVTASRDLS